MARVIHFLAALLPLLLILPVVEAASPAPPAQLHLVWTGDPATTMTITWAARAPGEATLAFGTTPGLELGTVAAGPPRGGEQRVGLAGLRPNTTYFYALRGAEASGVLAFRTAPAEPLGFPFLAVGDMGTSAAAKATVEALARRPRAFTLHVGDLAYADDRAMWNRWLDLIEPVAAAAPYVTAPGNHEGQLPGGIGTYAEAFPRPREDGAAPRALYYSFNYSVVHFVALDTHEADYPGPAWDPLQTAWLQRDLAAAANDPAHPWIVAFFHFPPFSSGGDHPSWVGGREAWGALFDRYGVDLAITAHSHVYERTWPVWSNGTVAARNYTNPPAPVYVVTGGGGADLDPLLRPPAWSAVRAAVHHFLAVEATGDALRVRALRPDGTVVDAFALERRGLPHLPILPLRAPPPPPAPKGRADDGVGGPDLRAFPLRVAVATRAAALAAIAVGLYRDRRRSPRPGGGGPGGHRGGASPKQFPTQLGKE